MPPPQDDIAFRSQEFAAQQNRDLEPARQRVQNAVSTFTQTAGQGAQMFMQGMDSKRRQMLAQRELDQRQQEINLKKDMQGGDLALQQLRINQAKEELTWARQIHDTKAVEAQRRIIEAQAEAAELNVKKLRRAMEAEDELPLDKNTLEAKLGAEASGMKVVVGPNGHAKVSGQLTPEETAAARKQYDALLQQQAAPMLAREKLRGEYGLQRDESRLIANELDALVEEITLADKLPKAAREEKRNELIGELGKLRRRLKALQGTAEDGEAEDKTAPGQAVGDQFYLDLLRSITGGK